MNKEEVISGNELIHHFLGGKWRMVSENRINHFVDQDFDTKALCQLECDKANRHRLNGEQWIAVPIPTKISGSGILEYQDSWDLLMRVVAKIEGFHLLFGICTDSAYIMSRGVEDEFLPWLEHFPEGAFYLNNSPTDDKITKVWKLCVAFIKWYNGNVLHK